jgi:hypothetical protein
MKSFDELINEAAPDWYPDSSEWADFGNDELEDEELSPELTPEEKQSVIIAIEEQLKNISIEDYELRDSRETLQSALEKLKLGQS